MWREELKMVLPMIFQTALLQLEVKRYKQVVVGAIADRRGFYHQFAVTYERAATNTVYPAFTLGEFKGRLPTKNLWQCLVRRKPWLEKTRGLPWPSQASSLLL